MVGSPGEEGFGEEAAGRTDAPTLLTRLVSGPRGPLLVALLLSAVSSPFVTAWLYLVPVSRNGAAPPMSPESAAGMALGAVLAGGLAGGFVGAHFVRTRPRLAAFLALAIAWPAGIAATPIVPWIVGRPFEYASLCEGACDPIIGIRGDESILIACGMALAWYGFSVLIATIAAAGIHVAIMGFLTYRSLANERTDPKWRRRTLPLAVLTWMFVNLISLLAAAGVALCLIAGVAFWYRTCARAGTVSRGAMDVVAAT